MTETEKATAVITALEDQAQAACRSSTTELADERNRIAFAAHVEADPKSRKRLRRDQCRTGYHGLGAGLI